MAIDAGIYQSIQPVPVNVPNPLAAAQALMTMKQLSSKMQKDAAEAESAKYDSIQKMVGVVGPAWEHLAGMPEDQRSAAYPGVIKQLADQGVDVSHFPSQYDSGFFRQSYGIWSHSKPMLENYLTQANIQKVQYETGNYEKEAQTKYQNMLGENEVYKKATGMLSEGKNALANINDAVKNPASAANVPIMLARFTSAGSRMNENEIEANLKAGNFGDKLLQMYTQSRTGTLSEPMAAYARQFLTTQMQSAAKNKLDVENDIAGKYAVARGLDKSVAYQKLTAQEPGTLASVPRSAPIDKRPNGSGGLISSANASDRGQTQLPPGIVRIRAPDGTVYRVPKAQAGAAIAQGGKVLK